MAEPETSPGLMRAIEVLSRLPPPPKPPPGTTWTRLAAALPPDDGTVFEVRFDGQPERYFISRRREEPRPWHGGKPQFAVSAASFGGRWAQPQLSGVCFTTDPIASKQPGWWRLLPADDPPPIPADAA